MPARHNPLKLNPLQLKTLTLLQELARDPRTSTRDEASGEAVITMIPPLHGDHIHIGRRVAMARDATGLANPAVWNALQRRGLARSSYPLMIRLTAEGLAYDTGLGDRILHGGDHE